MRYTEHIQIIEVIYTDKKKDGTPLIRNGEPYRMIHIKGVDDSGQEKWISKFCNNDDDKNNKLVTELKSFIGKRVEMGIRKHGDYYDFLYIDNEEQDNIN